MIIDQLKNHSLYPFGNAWKLSFDFLNTLSPDTEDKKYNIQGDDIFAIVSSYMTRSPENAIIETHRKYLDIQTLLSGSERIECSSKDGLEIQTAYDESKDAEFYKHNRLRNIKVDIFPGTFVVFFPKDAHMPSLMIDHRPELVKKAVIKLPVALIN